MKKNFYFWGFALLISYFIVGNLGWYIHATYDFSKENRFLVEAVDSVITEAVSSPSRIVVTSKDGYYWHSVSGVDSLKNWRSLNKI